MTGTDWPDVPEPGTVAPGDLPGDPDPAERRLRLTPASRIRLRPVRWTWADRMPAGAITTIPGREGIGKSLALTWLTARLTRGELPGIHYGTPRAVFYAATEDSWSHTIAPRMVAAGADLDLVYRVDVEETGTLMPLSLPRDCRALAVEARRLGVAMLALDPLMSVIASGIDTHRDRELRTALDPLAALGDETGMAVAALAHFNKGASNDALNLITGSRAFSAVSRAVIAVARDPEAEDGSCVLSQAKNNLGRLDLPSLTYVIDSATIDTDEGPAYVGQLRFTGESERSVEDILGERGDSDDRGERNEAVEWLRDYLEAAGGVARSSEVVEKAKADGIAERTLKRARTKAGVISERVGFGAGSLWRLPPSVPRSGRSGQDMEPGTDGTNGRHCTVCRFPLSDPTPGVDTHPNCDQGAFA